MNKNQMTLWDKNHPANVSIPHRKWRELSEYKSGHAIFWGINSEMEYGEFIVSGYAPDPDHIQDVGGRGLVDDFGRHIEGEVWFWQSYPKTKD